MITQIYEIQTPGEAEVLCGLGVDHIGSVILAADDWRQPVIRETVRKVQDLRKRSTLIPLYNDPQTVYRTLDYYRPDMVHFCDMLSPGAVGEDHCGRLVDLQREIRGRYPGIAIMRSIPVAAAHTPDAVSALALAGLFQPVSDYFLTDTVLSSDGGCTSQPVAGFVGITGQTCCWETARQLAAESATPVILAGGLSAENVYAAIRFVKPAGVDSCTRTNRRDEQGRPIRFQKDMARVDRFVREARRATVALGKEGRTARPAGTIHGQ